VVSLNVQEIVSLIELYMDRSLYENDMENTDSSGIFEEMIEKEIENLNGTSNSIQNTSVNSADEASNKLNQYDSDSINNAIDYVSKKYNVDSEFIKAVIGRESSFNPDAVSGCGAEGLMQLMPAAQKELGVSNPFDILDNINGGTKYLKTLLDAFSGNKELALAAYNGGLGRMRKLGVDTAPEINKMPYETQKYVENVMKDYENYKKNNQVTK
jgi:soluble lytic murein transglycosylase-like protein